MLSEPLGYPRLLVSVRDAVEARAAWDGGCDILDVKEPARGPLGMADLPMIDAIVRLRPSAVGCVQRTPAAADCAFHAPDRPVSAALGELHQWREAAAIPALPGGLDFVKLGLAGMAEVIRWPAVWRNVRRRFDDAAGRPLTWVAVVYADARPAAAPDPAAVIAAALETGCAAVLFDTFDKTVGGLLDALPPERLRTFVETLHHHGLLAALAGGVRLETLPQLREIGPNIIALRGAACRDGCRDAPLCPDRVRALRAALS